MITNCPKCSKKHTEDSDLCDSCGELEAIKEEIDYKIRLECNLGEMISQAENLYDQSKENV